MTVDSSDESIVIIDDSRDDSLIESDGGGGGASASLAPSSDSISPSSAGPTLRELCVGENVQSIRMRVLQKLDWISILIFECFEPHYTCTGNASRNPIRFLI